LENQESWKKDSQKTRNLQFIYKNLSMYNKIKRETVNVEMREYEDLRIDYLYQSSLFVSVKFLFNYHRQQVILIEHCSVLVFGIQ